MKILHISGATGWGGNEQQMINVIPELRKFGVENIVFGIDNSLLQKECELNNIRFINARKNKLNTFINYRYLKTVVNEMKPDLIHLHTSDSLTVFTISDLLFGLKTNTIFSKKGMGNSSSVLSKFKYNYSGISSYFCVSKSVENEFRKILFKKNISKTVVIHDCVSLQIIKSDTDYNLRDKFSIAKDNLIVGNIANHTKAKDLDTFINVADYVINVVQKKEVRFVQVGEFTNLTSELLLKVKEKKLDDYLFFTDKIKNGNALNSQFDVFLMTSQREGGPTSVLEAMLIGVPVVSTNVGVLPEIIVDNENGFISPVKDYKDLVTKLVLLLSDQALQKKFKEVNKIKISNEFNSEYIANETYIEYQRILKK